MLLSVAVACGACGGGQSGGSNAVWEAAWAKANANLEKGFEEISESGTFAIDPAFAFETLAELTKDEPAEMKGRRCRGEALFMLSLAAVAGNVGGEARIAKVTGSNGDALMKRSSSRIDAKCAKTPVAQTNAARAYAIFYRRTQRVGKGMAYANKALELAPDGSFEKVAAYGALADVFDALGLFERRDEARAKAIDTGRAYLRLPSRASGRGMQQRVEAASKHVIGRFTGENTKGTDTTPQEGLAYVAAWTAILDTALEEMSWAPPGRQRDLDRMHGIWADLETACPAVSATCNLFQNEYPRAVIRFARVGDLAQADQLIKTLHSEGPEWATKPDAGAYADPVNVPAADAAMLAAAGKTGPAADKWEEWLQKRAAGGKKFEVLNGDDYRLVGLAQEADGRYEKAIATLEKSIALTESNRSSVDVESRLRFLRGRAITAYWGLLRSYAKRFIAKHDNADFDKSLRASTMVNGRQFGELLGVEQSETSSATFPLLSDEIVLLVVQTDSGILSLAFGSGWREAKITPEPATAFDARIRRVKAAISKPGGARNVAADLAVLSEVVFSGIPRDRAARAKRLTVIADGTVASIPFALLPESGGSPMLTSTPIISKRAVAYAPSLAILKRARTQKSSGSGSGGGSGGESDSVFALGNPLYGKLEIGTADAPSAQRFERAVNNLRLITPLPETEAEAQSVLKTFGGKGTLLVGREAREGKIKSLDLSGYGYLHFATHGILGNHLPGVNEPALILAAEQGEDGLLTMSEVQKLKLHAKLAVLSACDTGSGDYFEGEGVLGLSRAFMLAGSRAVLATLWPIDSEGTVAIMNGFYKKIREGQSPTEALRSIQVAFLSKSGSANAAGDERNLVLEGKPGPATAPRSPDITLNDPYYWAPFVLLGE
jgi:CHAT domain-containing protein/tetratricopeptide (TPR) repeat protein